MSQLEAIALDVAKQLGWPEEKAGGTGPLLDLRESLLAHHQAGADGEEKPTLVAKRLPDRRDRLATKEAPALDIVEQAHHLAYLHGQDSENRVARIREMFTLNLEVGEWVARCNGHIIFHDRDRVKVAEEARCRHGHFAHEDEMAAFREIFWLPEPAPFEDDEMLDAAASA